MEACYLFGKRFTNCFLIPQRFILGIMTSLATFTGYTMRVALSIGITEMVEAKNESEIILDDTCPILEEETYHAVKNTDVLYDWDEMTQGLILSSFYWGYIITHLPGALTAEKMGGKHVLGIGMLINTILTIVSPNVIIATNGDWVVMVVMRLFMGMGQGMLYPVVTALLAQWAPPKERSLLASVTYAGALLGTVITNSVSGILIAKAEHWNIVFYFFGCLGLVWNLAWQLVCYSYPRTHPCLKDKEKKFLEEAMAERVSKTSLKTPWKNILSSVPVWALITAQFGHDWGWFTMVTDLPKYMHAVLRFNVQQNGLVSALPYFIMWIASIGVGYLADWIIERKYLSVRMTRIIFGTLGQTFPGIFMVLASYVGCRRTLAVTLFTLSLFFMAFYFAGIKVNALDLSPNFAGTIMALANGLGVFAGMGAPAAVGALAPNQTLGEWRLVFWIAFVWLAATNLVYVIFMSPEVQSWNYAKDEDETN